MQKGFVSERYKYGGTLDFYCKVDGKFTLVDFKSGKGIFNEHFLQVSSYANLLTENKYKVEQIMILNIGRNENEPFDHKEIKMPKKGSKVAVIGSIENRTWEDDNGDKHKVTEVKCSEIEFLSSKRDDNSDEPPKKGKSKPRLQEIDDDGGYMNWEDF